MAKLIYVISTSLDLYVEDATGAFDWANPDPVLAPAIEMFRSIKTCLYGRRLYQAMAFWDGPVDRYLPEARDFARAWQNTEKIVFSRTLAEATTRNTRIEREFDFEAVQTLKQDSEHDISIGGAELAALALDAHLVDECHLFVNPVILGGGKPAFRTALRRNLELLDTRRLSSGVIHLRYRVINDEARALGDALATAVIFRSKEHFDRTWDVLAETQSGVRPAEVGDGRFDELEILTAFVATYAVNVAFASNPQYKSEVLREFRTSYLEAQNDEDRSDLSALLEDRFARYETALRARRDHEREDDALAKAFADVCQQDRYDFCSVISDLVAQELIVMRGVMRRP